MLIPSGNEGWLKNVSSTNAKAERGGPRQESGSLFFRSFETPPLSCLLLLAGLTPSIDLEKGSTATAVLCLPCALPSRTTLLDLRRYLFSQEQGNQSSSSPSITSYFSAPQRPRPAESPKRASPTHLDLATRTGDPPDGLSLSCPAKPSPCAILQQAHPAHHIKKRAKPCDPRRAQGPPKGSPRARAFGKPLRPPS
jgi:hypothetical protein